MQPLPARPLKRAAGPRPRRAGCGCGALGMAGAVVTSLGAAPGGGREGEPAQTTAPRTRCRRSLLRQPKHFRRGSGQRRGRCRCARRGRLPGHFPGVPRESGTNSPFGRRELCPACCRGHCPPPSGGAAWAAGCSPLAGGRSWAAAPGPAPARGGGTSPRCCSGPTARASGRRREG